MKNTRSNHSKDTIFNVENSSNTKGKNHGFSQQTLITIVKSWITTRRAAAYKIIFSLEPVRGEQAPWPKPPATGFYFAPSEVGLYNV
jgi:hypothetical protein